MFQQSRPISPPAVLSDDTIRKLKTATASAGRTAHKRHIALRDQTIFALALGTGLREFEIAALTIGDAFELIDNEPRARSWVLLRVFKGSKRKPKARTEAQRKALAKRAAQRGEPAAKPAKQPKPPKPQRIYVPATVRAALDTFLAAKRARRERVTAEAPIFAGRAGKPVSLRLLRHIVALWQERAGVEHNRFHNMRHTAITRYYDHTNNLKAVQDFARHASLVTTQRYIHVANEYREQTADAMAASWG